MIEYVTEEILSELIEDEEYVGVFYSGQNCIPQKDDEEDFLGMVSHKISLIMIFGHNSFIKGEQFL